MRILTVYVGQGELAVIQHQGEAVIVDSFWPDDRSSNIERQVRLLLKNQSVAGLILTGFDSDHADPYGIHHILENFTPDWIMYPKYYKDSENASNVFAVIRKHEHRRQGTSVPLRRLSVRLDRYERSFGNLSHFFNFELFSPHMDDMDNSNNCSIVCKLTGNGKDGFSYLITGDTEINRWDTISYLFGKKLKSDVLSAPHHGSKNAAHPKMALYASPNTVLISAGVDNQYGHPDARAVKLYGRVAKHVFQTNIENGVSLLTRREGNEFLTRCVK